MIAITSLLRREPRTLTICQAEGRMSRPSGSPSSVLRRLSRRQSKTDVPSCGVAGQLDRQALLAEGHDLSGVCLRSGHEQIDVGDPAYWHQLDAP
jgi:hypothetical protein